MPVEIIDVSEDLIRLTPGLCMEMPRQRIPCRPGPQLGSRYPGDPHGLTTLLDFLPDPQLEKAVNLEDFAGMLVFDKWTRNSNGRQTLFRRTQDLVATAKQKPGKTHQAFIFFHIKLNTDN
jgi:hypothetical protein